MTTFCCSKRIPLKAGFSNLAEALCYYQIELLPVLLLELHICTRALNPALGFTNYQIAEIFFAGGHQQRLPKDPLISDLSKHPELWSHRYPNFRMLYNLVKEKLAEKEKFGLLSAYDVAKRIGFTQGLLPENEVYLCSHTVKEAAKKFLGKTSIGEIVPVSEFDGLLEPLKGWEIENFLCDMAQCLGYRDVDKSVIPNFDSIQYRNFYSSGVLEKLGLRISE